MCIMLCGVPFHKFWISDSDNPLQIHFFRCSLSFETVSHLLEEVGTREGGMRLRELDVRRNTSETASSLVIRARRRLDVLKVHSGCQCCF